MVLMPRSGRFVLMIPSTHSLAFDDDLFAALDKVAARTSDRGHHG
jgi:hypothetical protein